jgi:hypothetical protein
MAGRSARRHTWGERPGERLDSAAANATHRSRGRIEAKEPYALDRPRFQIRRQRDFCRRRLRALLLTSEPQFKSGEHVLHKKFGRRWTLYLDFVVDDLDVAVKPTGARRPPPSSL